jgi:hypothetical protein
MSDILSASKDRLKEVGLVTPSLAQATAINNLSNPESIAKRTLSVISAKELPRLNLLMALSDLTGYEWIKKSYDNELECRASMNRKGTRGRDDLVKICQGQEESKGALDSFKEKISSFFKA